MINKKLPLTLQAFVLPLVYALFMHKLFLASAWTTFLSVMTVSFLFFIPAAVGALTVYLSGKKRAASSPYRIFAPWVPLFAFVITTTLLVKTEGWACWAMVLPLFMLSSSLGGWVGGYLKIKDAGEGGQMQVSAILVLPLILSPIEKLIEKIPGTYEAYTVIDIQAPAGVIWSKVTRVSEIPKNQDKGHLTNFLGFPRPVRAELNFEGVGAYREAIFTNGLVFHETVSEYTPEKKMVFAIKAFPHEIPSTTMDKHVVIGGDYFDVLNGTYELEKIGANSYKLHLYSHFKLNTTFNFYASWWARWIMQDIQNNILQILKRRSEKA